MIDGILGSDSNGKDTLDIAWITILCNFEWEHYHFSMFVHDSVLSPRSAKPAYRTSDLHYLICTTREAGPSGPLYI